MPVRDHQEIAVEDFYGLYQRGKTTSDADACPIDHFKDCNNIQFAMREFSTRDGITTLSGPGDVVRLYKYKSPTLGEGLLSLNSDGEFKHTTYDPTNVVTILTVAGATDFAFVEIAGRAYITPFTTYFDAITGVALEKGLLGEFVYVYKGDGTNARKAAGPPPTNASKKPFLAYNSETDGHISQNVHVIAVAFGDAAGGDESN